MDKKQPNRLGRGLGSLLGGAEIPVFADVPIRTSIDTGTTIKIESIEPNPDQPRKHFNEQSLSELAASIKSFGLIQPITVRPIQNGKYQLISGERRFRASQMAGLIDVPVYVRTVDEVSALQMALVENIQRENLNAMEIAISYQRLLDECNLSHEELSDKVGKERATVTNYLRLLRLCREAQMSVRDKQISMGHARALVVIENIELQQKILKEIINHQLSVRQTETLVKKYVAEVNPAKTKVKVNLSENIILFSKDLASKLKAKVAIQKDITGKGKITISFNSDEELFQLIEKMH